MLGNSSFNTRVVNCITIPLKNSNLSLLLILVLEYTRVNSENHTILEEWSDSEGMFPLCQSKNNFCSVVIPSSFVNGIPKVSSLRIFLCEFFAFDAIVVI